MITVTAAKPWASPNSAPSHHVARPINANAPVYRSANTCPFTRWIRNPTTRARSGSSTTIVPRRYGRSIRDSPASCPATMRPVRITVATNPNVAHPAQSTTSTTYPWVGGRNGARLERDGYEPRSPRGSADGTAGCASSFGDGANLPSKPSVATYATTTPMMTSGTDATPPLDVRTVAITIAERGSFRNATTATPIPTATAGV